MSNSTLQAVLCVSGIYASYLVYGIVQEGLYKPKDGQTPFNFTAFLLLVNSLGSALIAGAALLLVQVAAKWQGQAAASKTLPGSGTDAPSSSSLWAWDVQLKFGLVSLTSTVAMAASNEALQFVGYPTQVLAKSCKPIPVMLSRVLYLKHKYPLRKYIVVLVMVAAVAMFQMVRISPKKPAPAAAPAADVTPAGEQDDGDSIGHLVWGWGLLALSLLCDGITGPVQEKVQRRVQLSSVAFMAMQNLWSAVWAGISFAWSGQGPAAWQTLVEHPELWSSVVLFTACSAVGQLFIYYTVLNFDSLFLTTVTTTRKFFTIVVSVMWFGNSLLWSQWSCVLAVFAALLYDKLGGKASKAAHGELKKQASSLDLSQALASEASPASNPAVHSTHARHRR